jgi:hypothetical protein
MQKHFTNDRMQLCKICDHPEEVASSQSEHKACTYQSDRS